MEREEKAAERVRLAGGGGICLVSFEKMMPRPTVQN